MIAVIENTAGQGSNAGFRFEQLAEIIEHVEDKSRVGVCIDTCHAFASGYELRNEKAFKETFDEFDKVVGLKYLKGLHLNDSKGELNSNRDRHDHIGLGEIGKEGLSEIIKIMNKHEIPIVLETPIDERRDDFGNIKQAKSLV